MQFPIAAFDDFAGSASKCCIRLLTHTTLALLVPCSFYDKDLPIYTMSRFLPPSKVVDCEVHNAIIGDGTLIKAGSRISNSVIGLRSLINEDCVVSEQDKNCTNMWLTACPYAACWYV